MQRNLLLTGSVVAALVLMLASNAFTVWAAPSKITICHVEPGIHGDRTLTLSAKSAERHLEEHPADSVGPCGV